MQQIHQGLYALNRPKTGETKPTSGSLKDRAIKANNRQFETDTEERTLPKVERVIRQETNSPPRDRKQMEENYQYRQSFINRPHQYDREMLKFNQDLDPLTQNMTKSSKSTNSQYHLATLKSLAQQKPAQKKKRQSPIRQLPVNLPQVTALQQTLDNNLGQFAQQMREIEEKIQLTQTNMEKM